VYFARYGCNAVSLFKLLTEKFCSKITKKMVLDEWDSTQHCKIFCLTTIEISSHFNAVVVTQNRRNAHGGSESHDLSQLFWAALAHLSKGQSC
jgi:hypothetical protein